MGRVKKLFYVLWAMILCGFVYADISSHLNITEQDGSPSVYPYKLKVTNGSLTDNGDGTASLSTGGGAGGSPSAPNMSVQYDNGGSFGGSANFLFDAVQGSATLSGQLAASTLMINEDSGFTAMTLYAPTICAVPVGSINTASILDLGDATGTCGTDSAIFLHDGGSATANFTPAGFGWGQSASIESQGALSVLGDVGGLTLSGNPVTIGFVKVYPSSATVAGSIQITSNTILGAGTTFYQDGTAILKNVTVTGTCTNCGAGGAGSKAPITYNLDGGGVVISSAAGSVQTFFEMPYAATISSYTLSCDATTSSINISVSTQAASDFYAGTAAGSICASACPSLSSKRRKGDGILTGWLTALTAGDYVVFDLAVTAPLVAKRCRMDLWLN